MSAEDWEQHRAFLSVLDEGSLSGAARALRLAQPTVRGRIEALERALGVVLFTRAPNGLLPTDVALSLREPARAMAHAADAFARTASAAPGEIAGVVRISASDVIAIEVLPPILAALRRAHPRLVVALSPNNRIEDVLRRESDIAVRMVAPRQDALVAQRIGLVPLGVHAHRDYLAAAGMPAALGDLAGHTLIGVERDSPLLRAVQQQGFAVSLRDFGFRSENDLAQLAAIRAGLGIGLCQTPLAAREPALVHLFADEFRFDMESWVVMHEDLRGVARVRVAFDAIVAGLKAYLAIQPSAAASIAVAAPRSV